MHNLTFNHHYNDKFFELLDPIIYIAIKKINQQPLSIKTLKNFLKLSILIVFNLGNILVSRRAPQESKVNRQYAITTNSIAQCRIFQAVPN